MSKVCVKCDEKKPREEFHKNRIAADGLRSSCRPCTLITQKERYDRRKKHLDSLGDTEGRESEDLKQCDACGEHFPLKGFHKHNWTEDGLRHSCKTCSPGRGEQKRGRGEGARHRYQSDDIDENYYQDIEKARGDYNRQHVEPDQATFPVIRREVVRKWVAGRGTCNSGEDLVES